MGKTNNTGKIQSIERMVNILDQFSMRNPELRFKEIVEGTGLNKSTAFNLISTMEYLGILEQDEITKAYRLGMHLMKLGEIAKKSIKIIDIAKPFMTKLRDKVNETVQLAKLENGFTVYLEKVECFQPIKTNSERGDAIPAYATGLGKALLAYRPNEYIKKYIPESLKKYTPNTIGSREELICVLSDVRSQGVAKDKGEFIEDLVCYAAPIFDYKGRVDYAISVSVPSYRLTPEQEAPLQIDIVNTARRISMELGYQG